MLEREDFSYGIVPLHKVNGEWSVLLVHQISYRGQDDTFWILPKGHAEPGESPHEAARRELAEETGITEVSVWDEPAFTIAYSFIHENEKINKTVTYYIGVCQSMETNIMHPHEIKAVRWVTFPEAEELLTHQNSKDIMRKVEAYMRTNVT